MRLSLDMFVRLIVRAQKHCSVRTLLHCYLRSISDFSAYVDDDKTKIVCYFKYMICTHIFATNFINQQHIDDN